jgi:hypothetical protein
MKLISGCLVVEIFEFWFETLDSELLWTVS